MFSTFFNGSPTVAVIIMSAKMGDNHGQGAKKKSPDARVELAAFGSHVIVKVRRSDQLS